MSANQKSDHSYENRNDNTEMTEPFHLISDSVPQEVGANQMSLQRRQLIKLTFVALELFNIQSELAVLQTSYNKL